MLPTKSPFEALEAHYPALQRVSIDGKFAHSFFVSLSNGNVKFEDSEHGCNPETC
jgi:hypothetical protein